VATIHRLALEHLRGGGSPEIFNCGYGHGASVLEVVGAMERVTGRKLPTVLQPRRAGDPPSLVANVDKLRERFAWQPRELSLDGIVRSALDWEKRIQD